MKAGSKGFTIIEVVLFVAITGLMFTVLAVATSGAVNRERYSDAVQTTLDYFQGQYNDAFNVQNFRTEKYSCGLVGGTPRVTSGGVDSERGRTPCSVVGRLIQSTDNTASRVVDVPLFAAADITAPSVRSILSDASRSTADKISAMQLLRPSSSVMATFEDVNDFPMPWQTALVSPGSDAAEPFSMMMVRIPYTNEIKVFLVTGATNASVATLSSRPVASGGVMFCVHPRGLVGQDKMSGVKIPQGASNVNSIALLTPEECAP